MGVDDSDSEADFRRKNARDDLDWLLRELTANLLRIVRGAGKPYYLREQLQRCLAAFDAYAEAHRMFPSTQELLDILDTDRALRDARHSTASEERERGMQLIRKGSLQVLAASLLGQRPQKVRGEYEIYEGIRVVNEAIAKNLASQSEHKA